MPQIELNTLLELVGDLNDDPDPGSPSQRFRKYLHENVHQMNDVRDYVDSSLAQSGAQFNKGGSFGDIYENGFKMNFKGEDGSGSMELDGGVMRIKGPDGEMMEIEIPGIE